MLNHYCISLPKNGLSVAEVLHYSIYVAVLQGAGELSGDCSQNCFVDA